jgi:hypothetical protein
MNARTEDRCGSNAEFVAVLEVADDGAGGTGCGVAIPAWLSGSPLREWQAKHKTFSDDREGWSHAAVLFKTRTTFFHPRCRGISQSGSLPAIVPVLQV